MSTLAGVVVIAGFLAIGSGLALYWLVRAEHDRRGEMDRERAETVARRDTDEEP